MKENQLLSYKFKLNIKASTVLKRVTGSPYIQINQKQL
jgi:hypothetical protein